MSTRFPNNPNPTATEIAAVSKKLNDETKAAKNALASGSAADYKKHMEEVRVCEQWFTAYVD